MTRKKCLKLLYRTCGYHALLPGALKVPVCYDRNCDVLYRSGYADVRKGRYRGEDVAVKVIRTYSNDELQQVISVGCSTSVYHVLITKFYIEVLQRGCDVEIPPTSKCPAADWSIDVRESVRNGIRVDAIREYQSIYQRISESKSTDAGTSPVCHLAPLVLTTEKSPARGCCKGPNLPPRQWNGSR